MKKSLLIFCAHIFAIAMCAQDVLITKEGDALKVFELEVTKKFVFYKESNDADSPIKRMTKQDLLMIKYNDGHKEIIGEEEESPATTNAAAPAAPPADYSDSVANAAAIERINAVDIKHVAKPLKREADILLYQCQIDEKSIIVDKNVELKFYAKPGMYNSFTKSFPHAQYGSIKVSIRNNSDKTIYVDLGKTFFTRGNESIQCYVPTATTQTSSSTTAASVNMGALANAMGVGGSAQTLASGINVGGAESSATTTITYAQRIVPLPPFTEKEIGTYELFPKQEQKIYENLTYKVLPFSALRDILHIFFQEGQIPKVGEERAIYNKDLVRFGMYIAYSDDEKQEAQHSLNAMFNLKKVIGFKAKKVVTDRMLNTKDISTNYEEAIYFIAQPKEF